MKWVKWPTAISAQSLHGALKCYPLPPRLHRWGSNVKWSVHRQGEVTQRVKGIVGRSGQREKVGIEKTAGENQEGLPRSESGFVDGTGHSVMTLISWNLPRSRSLSLISVLTFLLDCQAMHMDTQILQTHQEKACQNSFIDKSSHKGR